MKAPLLLAAVLAALAIGATAAVGGTRANLDSVGTLQVNSTLAIEFGPADCLPGVPAATVCFQGGTRGSNVVPGLGSVSAGHSFSGVWEGFGEPCGRFHQQIPLLVAGKGEIDLAVATSGCWTSDNFPLAALAVTGGTRGYAGPTGSGTLEDQNPNHTRPHARKRHITSAGTPNDARFALET